MTSTTTVNNLVNNIRMVLYSPRKIYRFLPTKSFYGQIFTAGFLATSGDLICQKFVEKREQIDRARTSRFALTTMLLIAPIQYRWFRYLERKFPTTQSANMKDRIKVATKRVAVDQICLAPLLTGIFLFAVNLADSRSPNSAFQKLKRIYPEVMSNNYKFWPFVQSVNMMFVPLHFRVIFLQFFAIFWNIYISHKANNWILEMENERKRSETMKPMISSQIKQNYY